MADRIKQLSDVVANQIAAGEVVNRPSSVVKEMMENAIDAGARCVKVNFRDGGKELIQIVDDGCGMSIVDARMAFDRHATSKINSVDDIYNLSTFGFRGEALASIAAVSEVELRTRQEGDECGTQVELQGGQFVSQQKVMTPVGSQFFVRNIFYNLPARRKFLEKSTTSSNQIKSEFQRVALCNPQVSFELYSSDAPLYKLPATTLVNRIVDVVGRSIKNNLLELSATTSIVNIEGYIGRPEAAKRRNAEQYLFVNGRYFKSAYLNSAVMKGYTKLIAEGSAPSFFIYLTIDPSRIDVNVHPQKTEVKFADDAAVWQIVNAAVRESLAKCGAVPMMDFDAEDCLDIPALDSGVRYSEPRAVSNSGYNPFNDMSGDEFSGVDEAYSPKHTAQNSLSTHSWRSGEDEFLDFTSDSFTQDPEPREMLDFVSSESFSTPQQSLPLGNELTLGDIIVTKDNYIIAQLDSETTLIDARRALERVLYESYYKRLSGGNSSSQQLLFAEELTLSMDEAALFELNSVEFATLGFDIEHVGEGRLLLKGIPSECTIDGVDTMIYELLQELSNPTSIEEQRRERLATRMAQGAARQKRGALSLTEAKHLVEELIATENYSYTPSGKTISARLTVEDIKLKIR